VGDREDRGSSRSTVFAERSVVDCDADASNIQILLSPKLIEKVSFAASRKARIDPNLCGGCGSCCEYCISDATSDAGSIEGAKSVIDRFRCEGASHSIESDLAHPI